MTKAIARNVATAAGVLFVGFVGYVVLTSLPDVRRYIRISTM
jgi:preprotein translocase subunit Sss1